MVTTDRRKGVRKEAGWLMPDREAPGRRATCICSWIRTWTDGGWQAGDDIGGLLRGGGAAGAVDLQRDLAAIDPRRVLIDGHRVVGRQHLLPGPRKLQRARDERGRSSGAGERPVVSDDHRTSADRNRGLERWFLTCRGSRAGSFVRAAE